MYSLLLYVFIRASEGEGKKKRGEESERKKERIQRPLFVPSEMLVFLASLFQSCGGYDCFLAGWLVYWLAGWLANLVTWLAKIDRYTSSSSGQLDQLLAI